MLKDITNDLHILNMDSKIAADKSDKNLKQQLCDIFQLYSDAKQFSKNYSNSNKNASFSSAKTKTLPFRFAQKMNKMFAICLTNCFLWGIATISCSLLVLHAEIVEYK